MVFIFNNNEFNSIKSMEGYVMTDKVKQIIWVFDLEDNKKKRINLQTLLTRVNSPFYWLNSRYKYFALEKDRDQFAKECRA